MQFRSPPKNQVKFNPNTEIKSITIPNLKSSQLRRADTKNKWISTHTLKPSHFGSPHINQVNSHPYTEIKSISILYTEINPIWPRTKKTRQFRFPNWNRVIFRPYTKITSISTPRTKKKSISIPHTKTKFNSTATLKSSQFLSPL